MPGMRMSLMTMSKAPPRTRPRASSALRVYSDRYPLFFRIACSDLQVLIWSSTIRICIDSFMKRFSPFG